MKRLAEKSRMSGVDMPAARRGRMSLGFATRERGVSAVEVALVLPLLILLVFGAIEFGRLVSARETVSQATRNGARFGSVIQHTDNGIPQYLDCDLIRLAATQTGGVISVAASDVAVTFDGGPSSPALGECPPPGSGAPTVPTSGGLSLSEDGIASGDRIAVTVSVELSLVTPIIRNFFGGEVTLTSTDRRTIFK